MKVARLVEKRIFPGRFISSVPIFQAMLGVGNHVSEHGVPVATSPIVHKHFMSTKQKQEER
jgi:hypothetical protein